MEVGSPSRTAILTAIHRAAHFVVDDPPKILADSFARALAGFSSDNEFLDVRFLETDCLHRILRDGTAL